MPRSEALATPDLVRLAVEVPNGEETRIVEVDGADILACGGTHVRGAGDVEGSRMIKAENKGKAKRRIYFQLDGDRL